MNDLALLKAVLDKGTYELVIKYLNLETCAYETKVIIKELGKIFTSGSVTKVPEPNLYDIVSKILDHDKDVIKTLVDNVINTPIYLVSDLIFHYAKTEFMHRVTEKGGNMIEIIKNFERLRHVCSQMEPSEDAELTPEDVFMSVTTPGLNWRLRILQNGVGPLRIGDFGIVGAFVDTGKSSFMCSELTHFAKQIPADGGPILYLNNEGLTAKIYQRLWTTGLNRTKHEIVANMDAAKLSYDKVVGKDKIKVINIMRMSPTDIEDLIAKHAPSLVVIDQLDNVRGFEKQSNGSHERYGFLYNWAREMAALYCPIIAVSQCDATVMSGRVGEEPRGQSKIGMHQLRGAKVDKQATADYIITIGSDLQSENIRYINIPKNKLNGLKLHGPVSFNPMTGRFSDHD
jgi:hypothetical protein